MTDHYFSTPDSAEVRRTVQATIWGRDFSFVTANGVFARDGLDQGTAVLLREVAAPTSGERFLDLGCGWGPIASALATVRPEATIDAVDTNERALALCAANARTAGVADRVHPATPEQLPAEPGHYDQIWSNPPIRIGKPALHALLLRWLPTLRPDGVAWLVVGKNLGADSLQRWLRDQDWTCERTASAKGFRILRVSAPCHSSTAE
ncbi:class I SAM-dependent methyltransferase [Propionibacteriaceae bacterium Y1685]|uniref:class I SAM-dependent methyltransferase n=1 Tax=Microlunatus sp. Y1700 TaxID=3418487 RepID=UPI003B7E0E9A